MDISQSSAFRNANICEIHEDTSFPIDEECPICIDQEDNEEITPYKEHIDVQDRYIERLKKDIIKLKEENEKLKKCVDATVRYLDADGSINADEIYDALDELIYDAVKETNKL